MFNIDMDVIRLAAGITVFVVLVGVGGWVFTTWLRVKHGYPLEGAAGETVYPRSSDETIERVKLIGSENAQLRAELSAVKDRLATVERIVTDGSYRLDREIETLRNSAN
jgi:hypothetical protein